MKMVKSLLLGTAAGLVAVAGAQAADLPVKAKPVEYVKICSLYGVGFYYIPGTDVCLKVGGWARFETGYGYNGSLTSEWWANNTAEPVDQRQSVAREGQHHASMPVARRNTARCAATSTSASAPARTASATGAGGGVTSDDFANYANRWFIQWAGFTAGRSASFFDFYSIGANQYGYVGASSDTGDGGWLVFAYTAQFGNGFSASLSAEEQRRTQILNVSAVQHDRWAGGRVWVPSDCGHVWRGLPGSRLSGRGRQLARRPSLGFCPGHGCLA